MSTVFTVTELDSAIEVCLISRSNDKFILTRVLDVLEEEAAPVVAVSYSRVGDKIHYIINSQVEISSDAIEQNDSISRLCLVLMSFDWFLQAVCSRIGIDSSRVHERLKRLTAGPWEKCTAKLSLLVPNALKMIGNCRIWRSDPPCGSYTYPKFILYFN